VLEGRERKFDRGEHSGGVGVKCCLTWRCVPEMLDIIIKWGGEDEEGDSLLRRAAEKKKKKGGVPPNGLNGFTPKKKGKGGTRGVKKGGGLRKFQVRL